MKEIAIYHRNAGGTFARRNQKKREKAFGRVIVAFLMFHNLRGREQIFLVLG